MKKEFQDYKVLVLGAGTMGNSIAQHLAATGHTVYMTSRHTETLEKASASIEAAIDNLIANQIADESYRESVHAHLHPITNDKIPDVAGDIDIVFETIAENKDAKQAIYEMLGKYCRSDCILASNTSGMDIFHVVEDVIDHPERLIIAHWFNPPHLMNLIEVVRGERTSDETTATIRGFLESTGKKPAVLNHFAPGFIVNRLATVIIRELYYMIDQGWISAQDAENAIRYTDGLRFGFEGPLALWDFVGLEIPMIVAKDVLPSLCNDTDRIPYGEKLIKEGKLGVKTGEGALKYDDPKEYVEKRNRRIIQMTKIMNQWDKEDQKK